MDDHLRRTSDFLRSTGDLAEYFRACREMGDLVLVESALRDVPEWASFQDVRTALGAAGLRLGVKPMSTLGEPGSPVAFERRRGPRRH